MKKTKTTLLLLAGILLLAGCQKEGRLGNDKGLIRFSAASAPETKTAYSGVLDNANYERIDWKLNDVIRIWSPDAYDRYHENGENEKHYADYKVSKVLNPEGRLSKAEIVNSDITFDSNGNQVGVPNPSAVDNVNGLVWGDAGTYRFYASYPVTANGTMGTITGSIDADQGAGDPEVNMPRYGYLTAATKVTTSSTITQINQDKFVTLEFEPAFTAFELSFESQDGPLKVTQVEISSTSTDLSGSFAVKYTENASGATTPFTKAFQFDQSGSGRVYAKLGTSGVEVSPGHPQTITLFALPKDQTDLTLTFTVIADNVEDTRSLKLTYAQNFTDDAGVAHTKGEYINFTACKKHRIVNIKMPNKIWRTILVLDGRVLPWDTEETSTSFTEHIQCTGLSFNESAIEMTAAWAQAHPDDGTNHYRLPAPIGDGRWQVRTLNQDDHYDSFTVTFRPIAPLGGYWGLDTHGNRFFKVELLTGYLDGEPTYITLPERNQIMDKTETLRVTPIWSAIAEADADEEIGLYMDCYFYTNIDSDPLNANTEFQDIHRNGTYSYWLLTVAR